MKHGKQTAWQFSLCKFDIFLKIIFPLLNFFTVYSLWKYQAKKIIDAVELFSFKGKEMAPY